MTCPDCERPMATDANLRSDATPRPEDDLLCWRALHGDRCQQPIDWRERCKAAEAMVVEVGVLRSVNASNELSIDRLIRECEERYQAHRDAQTMLEEVAAERDEQIVATVCERELWEIFADCRWEEVWARDAALEACQERISSLLDRISGLLSERALLVAHIDEARENAPRALTDALSDIARIAGERDHAQREASMLHAIVLGLLAVRMLIPDHIEVLREMRREAAVQQARVGADEYAPAWAVEESRARVEALGAVLGEEPSDA